MIKSLNSILPLGHLQQEGWNSMKYCPPGASARMKSLIKVTVFLGGTVVSVVAGSSGGDSERENNRISFVSPTINTDELDTPSTRIIFTLISLLMTVICMRMLRSLRYRSDMFIDGNMDIIFTLSTI